MSQTEEHLYWNQTAADYDTANQYVVGAQTCRQIQNWLKQQINKTDSVLELGCGTGLFSAIIAEKAKHLIATDLADEMLNLVRQRLGNSPRILVQKEDCYHLSFADATIDVLFLGNVLHIVADPEQVLAEAARVLRKNGRIIVIDATTHGLSPWRRLRMAFRYLRAFGLPPKTNKSLKPAGLSDLVQAAGFTITDTDFIGTETRVICLTGQRN